MRAVVLVGGFGTRLRPLTDATPKQMLTIGHRPMLEHVVGHLARYDIEEVVLSLGFRPDAFQDAYPNDTCAGVAIRYAIEPEPLDTAGAISFAARHAGVAETFLVCNGDVITDLAVDNLIEQHQATGAAATIALVPVSDPDRYGVVPTDDNDRVLGFIEKPSVGEAPTNMINAGTYVFEPSVLDRIPEGRPMSVERELFPAMVGNGVLFAMASDCYWIDAGTPSTYLVSNLDSVRQTRKGVHPEAFVDPTSSVSDSVVGPRAVVAAGASIERSVVLDGATIGENAEVKGSIVGPEGDIAKGASVIGLSVIGPGARVEFGECVDGIRRSRLEG